jgi:hypothetical protein
LIGEHIITFGQTGACIVQTVHVKAQTHRI